MVHICIACLECNELHSELDLIQSKMDQHSSSINDKIFSVSVISFIEVMLLPWFVCSFGCEQDSQKVMDDFY